MTTFATPDPTPWFADYLAEKTVFGSQSLTSGKCPKMPVLAAWTFITMLYLMTGFLREPYNPVDWLCRIHYLTDTVPGTPAFCVVPGSNRFETLKEARQSQGDDYQEVPIYGKAGTCILYDTATFHTRFDGDGRQKRRSWHQYFARGGWLKSSLPTTSRYVRSPSPALTDWNLFSGTTGVSP